MLKYSTLIVSHKLGLASYKLIASLHVESTSLLERRAWGVEASQVFALVCIMGKVALFL